MPITEGEWASIRAMIERVSSEVNGNRGDFFITGKVIRRDEAKKLVWIKEMGDQPIPVVDFNYTVKYYDETPRGTSAPSQGSANPYKTQVKKATITVEVPKLGTSILVARELGSRRLPRCLGIIQGKNWLVPENE